MARQQPQLTVRGTDGDDILPVPAGARLSKTIFDGGRGNDTLDLTNYSSPGVHVMLQSGVAKAASAVWETPFTGAFSTVQPNSAIKASGTIKNVESIIGTAGNDMLTLFTPASPTKFADGGAGNDSVNPRGGTGIGGTGSDWLISYGAGNIFIGGTFVGGVATGDGEKDQYYLNSAPRILDFEIGIDKLVFERDASLIAAFESAAWMPDGGGGARLYVNGILAVTLAGVLPGDAEDIAFGFALSPVNGVHRGSSGDDMLYSSSGSERIILNAGSGDDLVVDFTLNDVLVFEGGAVPTWSNTMINGQPALLGTFGTSSVTLEGYSVAAVPSLIIEGYDGPDLFAAAGMGSWSVSTDAAYFV